MRKDIQALNEAFNSVIKEQSDNTDMNEAPTSPTKFALINRTFYNVWEDIVDRLSDEELEATMHMIKKHDELNKLVDEEYRYRFLSTIE